LACNLIYTHLLDRMTHAEGCDPRQGCVHECDVDSFLRVLEAPLLDFEVVAEDRARERRAALMRGDINVA
jgi:hypothetical protein